MSKTLNAQQLQELIKDLFDSYMRLPYKTGRSFADYYICLSCKKINNESATCKCNRTSTTKKPRKRKSKKKSGIPQAIRSTVLL